VHLGNQSEPASLGAEPSFAAVVSRPSEPIPVGERGCEGAPKCRRASEAVMRVARRNRSAHSVSDISWRSTYTAVRDSFMLTDPCEARRGISEYQAHTRYLRS
jgi:hypothetical protein